MVRKYPNQRSGDLGISIQGVPWEFLFLIWILNTKGFILHSIFLNTFFRTTLK